MYLCKFCNKTYAHKANYLRHSHKHQSNELQSEINEYLKFICTNCNKGFPRLYNLERHIKKCDQKLSKITRIQQIFTHVIQTHSHVNENSDLYIEFNKLIDDIANQTDNITIEDIPMIKTNSIRCEDKPKESNKNSTVNNNHIHINNNFS